MVETVLELRKCTVCGVEKTLCLENFERTDSKDVRYRGTCRACRTDKQNARYAEKIKYRVKVPKPPKVKPIVTTRQCKKCGAVKDINAANFRPTAINVTRFSKTCTECSTESQRECKKCGSWKPLTSSYFPYTDARHKYFLRKCKACTLQDHRDAHQRSLEQRTARRKAYREAKAEQIRAKKRADYIKLRDEFPERLQAARDKAAATGLPAKYAREWRKVNRDLVAMYHATRKHRLRNCVNTLTTAEWKEVKEQYNYQCLCCKKYEPEIKLGIDHVIPLALGGNNTRENIQPLCFKCNSRKNIKTTDYRIAENRPTSSRSGNSVCQAAQQNSTSYVGIASSPC